MEIVKADPEKFVPLCPYCEKSLPQVYRLEDESGLLKAHMGYCFACPHCRKVLGFADFAGR